MDEIRFVPRNAEGAAEEADFGPEPLRGWIGALLRARGIRTREEAERFLSPSAAEMHNPFLLPGMERTVALLREAIRRGERILVYGDYDADGVCATSILLDLLHEEKAELAYRIPSRHTEGYGLNAGAVREIAEKCRVLITVDCGISNFDEVALAKELGLTVIITDHHEVPERLPEADAVMDPKIGDYPCPWLCGAGVALKICQAMQGTEGALRRMDLAALATVADIVPLMGENRFIVAEGLRRMERTERPGLRALMDSAGVAPPLRSADIAYRIGPRINAAGRLGDARLGVHLLLTPDAGKAKFIAGEMEKANRERQEAEARITAEAERQLAADGGAKGRRVILVSGEGWNPGLIGLTAGKLCERYGLPSVALSLEGEKAKGSCRSIPGVDIYRILRGCEELLEGYGGHEQAAGLTVRRENIPALRDRMDKLIRESTSEACFVPSREYDAEVPFGEWTEERMRMLEKLEPTGCGNPEPAFLIRGAEVLSMRAVGRDGAHLKLSLMDGGGSVMDGIAFGQGERTGSGWRRMDLIYLPERNEYRGRVSIQARIGALRRAEAETEAPGGD